MLEDGNAMRPRPNRIWMGIWVPLFAALGGCGTALGTPTEFKASELWAVPPELDISAAPEAAKTDHLPDVLDLPSAIRIALEENPNLKTAFMRVEAAKARMAATVAPYFPVIDATAGWTRTFNTPIQRTIPGFNQEADLWQARLRASWLIFDGLTRAYRVKAAGYGVEESEAAHDDARRLLKVAVETAYFDALGAIEDLRIADAELAFQRELLEETAKRYRAGDRSLSDKLNFEVGVQTALGLRIDVKARLASLRVALAELLGLEGGRLPARVELDKLLEETPEELAPLHVDRLVKDALEHRPDLGGLVAAAERTRAEVNAANGTWWPSLSMVGWMGRERFDDPHLRTEDTSTSLALEATWNLFSGGLRLAAHKEAVANQRAAEANLADVRNRVIAEVRRAGVAVTAAQKQVEVQREKVRLTRETRDLVRKEYDAGKQSLVRLNEVQRDFIVARARLVEARVSLRTAWARLRAAVAR
jgi:outer membrane protein TolC